MISTMILPTYLFIMLPLQNTKGFIYISLILLKKNHSELNCYVSEMCTDSGGLLPKGDMDTYTLPKAMPFHHFSMC